MARRQRSVSYWPEEGRRLADRRRETERGRGGTTTRRENEWIRWSRGGEGRRGKGSHMSV
jgi:hypothetical protein